MQEFEYLQKLMGTDFSVSIVSEEAPHLIYADLLNLGMEYEKEFSRFITQSALSILNEKKTGQVSQRFCSVFKQAKKLFQLTNGIFNPLVQLKTLGYDRDFLQLKNFQRETMQNNENAKEWNLAFEEIEFNEEKRTIALQPNQTLDFAGFLKGYVAEEMMKKLAQFSGAIVNIGGDIATHGKDKNNEHFQFNIYNPATDKDNIKVTLKNQCMATSGVYKRNWQIEGKNYSHIVDPRNKRSVESDLISVTVIANSTCIADAFATTTFILGENNGQKFLKQNNCDFILIKSNGDIILSDQILPQVTILQ